MEEILKVREEELELTGMDGGGSPMYNYKNKPFTGIMLIYEDEGWLSGEFEHQNGYLEGWTREYYKNGQLKEEYQLHNNEVKPGTHNLFDEEGNKLNII